MSTPADLVRSLYPNQTFSSQAIAVLFAASRSSRTGRPGCSRRWRPTTTRANVAGLW